MRRVLLRLPRERGIVCAGCDTRTYYMKVPRPGCFVGGGCSRAGLSDRLLSMTDSCGGFRFSSTSSSRKRGYSAVSLTGRLVGDVSPRSGHGVARLCALDSRFRGNDRKKKSGNDVDGGGNRRCQLVADAVTDENQATLTLTSILSQDGRGGFRKFYLRGNDGKGKARMTGN
jgi:hypothetical protein